MLGREPATTILSRHHTRQSALLGESLEILRHKPDLNGTAGRPPLAKGAKRSQHIALYVTPEEKLALEERAQGKPLSLWILGQMGVDRG